MSSRVRAKAVADKLMSAQEAAEFILPGDNVGMSGFTGAGHPKAVPAALVDRVVEARRRGKRFAVGVWTGARWRLGGRRRNDLRMPYQSDPVSRAKINDGSLD